MKSKRLLLYRAGSIVLILLLAGAMFIVGRGHTVYFDNKTLDYQGQTYSAPYKAVVLSTDGEELAKLYKKERGMDTCIGQHYQMTLEITEKKGGDKVSSTYSLTLPYSLDGIVVNLPGLIAGLPAEAYLSTFVPVATQEEPAEEEIVTEEFGLSDF